MRTSTVIPVSPHPDARDDIFLSIHRKRILFHLRINRVVFHPDCFCRRCKILTNQIKFMPRRIPDRRYQIPNPSIIFRLILNGQTGVAARYRRILAPKYGALRLPCPLFPSFQTFPKRQHGGILLCSHFWDLAASFIFDINFFSSCSIQFKYLR